MDIATLLGLIGGLIIVFVAMTANADVNLFVNLPSIMIVLGGTMAATLVKFPLTHVFNAIKVAVNAFRYDAENPRDLIAEAHEMADVVRKQGVLALEDFEVRDPFFRKGMMLVVDGHNVEFLRKVLTEEMEQSLERHEIGQRIFRAMGESAPAFGMIGTLVGLVQMLNTMSDPNSIGPAMAVALLTTLYGALIANLVALPIADKLELRSMQEHLNQHLITESLLSIQAGENPRVMEELLESFLPSRQRRHAQGEEPSGATEETPGKEQQP